VAYQNHRVVPAHLGAESTEKIRCHTSGVIDCL
jgi:hypothetical protein